MHRFEVWAPRVNALSVFVNDSAHPMQREERDWWSAEVASAKPGDDYLFVLEDGSKVPDPRSAYQPQGVNGPSRIVDHNAFAWSDQLWQAKPLASAVVYELHIGTFTQEGTFQSAIGRLDYLADLGVTHVELMPVNEFSGKWGWGYDGVDLCAPHHAYGTPDDLKAFVNACHQKGMAVLLDVVYNHFGPVGNYLDKFGPYFTDAYKTPWGPAVNLDHEGSCETRRFFADNAEMWLRDYHFDGLRLDAVHAYFDKSAIHFLEYLSERVEALSARLGRHLVLIAESDLNDPRVVRSREGGGLGIDAQWSDDFHHALHTVLTGEASGYYEEFGSLQQLAKALKQSYVYDGIYSDHRKRLHGKTPSGLPGDRFLAYSQNHDQIGNRAKGERMGHLVSQGKAKIAAALVFASPFVPMIFQGEEFNASAPFQYFTHHEDQALGKAVSEGRRSEFKAFGWNPEDVPDPQDTETFQRSKLNWNEVSEGAHQDMLRWYKELIHLRKTVADLADPDLSKVEVEYNAREQWLVLRRGDTLVACNLSSDRHAVPIRTDIARVVASQSDVANRPGLLEMPAESVAIVIPQKAASLREHFREHAA